jgi:hypothetical protein
VNTAALKSIRKTSTDLAAPPWVLRSPGGERVDLLCDAAVDARVPAAHLQQRCGRISEAVARPRTLTASCSQQGQLLLMRLCRTPCNRLATTSGIWRDVLHADMLPAAATHQSTEKAMGRTYVMSNSCRSTSCGRTGPSARQKTTVCSRPAHTRHPIRTVKQSSHRRSSRPHRHALGSSMNTEPTYRASHSSALPSLGVAPAPAGRRTAGLAHCGQQLSFTTGKP